MEARRLLGMLLVGLATTAGAPAQGVGTWRLVSVETAPAPEPPLPHQLLRPEAPLPARILVGAGAVTQGGPWQHSLCTDPAEARDRLLRGLREASAGPDPSGEALRAYRPLLRGCPERSDDPAHARWLRRAAEDEPAGAARDLLYEALSRVHPLGAPAVFEDARAPDDAVVSYHARRSGESAHLHSARLAEIVARRLDEGDERGLEAAARSYARLDHPRVVRSFKGLLERAPEGPLHDALWRALRESPRSDGHAIFVAHCAAWLDDARAAWREQGAPIRGSPTRFGSPCAKERWSRLRLQQAPRTAELPAAPCPFVSGSTPPPPAHPGTCIDVPAKRAMQLQSDAELLRRLARWLGPHLGGAEGAVFAERWPAVEAVGLDHGPARIPVHVRDGDQVFAGVPLRADGDADLEFARELGRALGEALDDERRLDAHLDGTRRRYAFTPCGWRWCGDLAVGVLNQLLDARQAPVRVRRDPAPDVLRLHVISVAGERIEGARGADATLAERGTAAYPRVRSATRAYASSTGITSSRGAEGRRSTTSVAPVSR